MNRKMDDQWTVQLKKGTFEIAILSLLRKRPMYGYEITSSLNDTDIFAISQGAIYPILKRMTAKRWIDFFWEESREGPRRKYYEITNEGERLLEERLTQYRSIYEAFILLSGMGDSDGWKKD